jgi:hypothetical protein
MWGFAFELKAEVGVARVSDGEFGYTRGLLDGAKDGDGVVQASERKTEALDKSQADK